MDKGTIEVVTVASEFCGFVEKVHKFSKHDFLSKLHKMLSLVYLKTSMLEPDQECSQLLEDGNSMAFLSEYEYDYIRGRMSDCLGKHDSYINIYDSASNDSGYEQTEISGCIADVYHNLKNFVENFRTGSEESAMASRAELISDFREYWGYRCLSVTAAVHAIIYSEDNLDDEEDYGKPGGDLRNMERNASGADSQEQGFLDRFLQTKR